MTTATEAPRPTPFRRLATADPLATLAGLSLIGLLVVNNDDVWLTVVGVAACLLTMRRPHVLTSSWLWTGLFVIVGIRQLATWHKVDDHTVAMTYWCGALAVGLRASDRRATVAASARLLIGSLFALAAGWKLFSGQFADGSFFRYTFLFDDRFEHVARLAGGTSSTVQRENIDAVSQLVGGSGSGTVLVEEGPRNVAIAQVFTWWGILVESAVAVTHLLPLPWRWGWLRHTALLAFACTTYLIVPIGGFGTLLLVLGSATVTTDRARIAYYRGAAVLLLWSGLWPLLFG